MLNNMKINFIYKINNEKKSITFDSSFENKDLKAEFIIEKKDNINKLTLSILPCVEIEVDQLFITSDYSFKDTDKIYVNGYQSWTDSREFFIDETLPNISKFTTPIIKKYQFDKYGDYNFANYSNKKGDFHGFTYSYIRSTNEKNGDKNEDGYLLIGSFTERNGYTIIEEKVSENKIIIKKDWHGHFIKSLTIPFQLLLTTGGYDEVFDRYFNNMNIKKPSGKPMNGWTSWYNYYQNINEEVILKNLNNFKSANKDIDIFQIDDGFQTAVGDWLSVDKNKFPKGMKYLADTIKSNGYKSGIWLAPFVCETTSQIFKEKNHWILRDENGELVLAGSNWSRFYALDIYNEEVREYIKKVFSVVLNDWGYDMVKLDFLYAACIIPRKYKTRGQIMTEAMEFLRECVGDKLILGCGVPLGPAFGLVDYCRIGCDISLDWDDKFFMKLIHRERVSTLNAIRNSIGRRHLNGRAFLNDPDVFLLRSDNITLTETQRKTLSIVNKIFGSLIFTSDDIEKYNNTKDSIFDYIMDLKDRKIENVTCYRDGLVVATYIENDERILTLINLSGSNIKYANNYSNLEEIFIDKTTTNLLDDSTIDVAAYDTRRFIM